jgi:hypothetical protein
MPSPSLPVASLVSVQRTLCAPKWALAANAIDAKLNALANYRGVALASDAMRHAHIPTTIALDGVEQGTFKRWNNVFAR